MIESELSPLEHDPGPPVLLKRLGNAFEANLAKNKLASAGIPSFLGGENTFAGDVMHPLPYREVELFVPQSMVAEALDILDAPPADPAELFGDPYLEDPSRAWSFRAFVCAIVGWLFLLPATYGFVFAAPVFVYSIYLSFRAVAASTERAPATIAKSVAALVIAAGGIAFMAVVLITLAR